MLEIKDLHVEVGGKEILKGINLVIQPGEVHAVMGPNGSGKSTLSYVLAGRPGYEVTGGSILYKGKDLTELEPNERTAAGVFPRLPVSDRGAGRYHHDLPQDARSTPCAWHAGKTSWTPCVSSSWCAARPRT